ncbi:unnamed protein product [Mytilus coruscus]|uniref:Reverse transcriptase domain-containing protein n=1 Tax=Mytilus coruscus TaxID=42192 RepID=A0A6J8CRK1_MYTCO|nr:unnamed protein product [Mytilus coruscus]
MVVVPKSNGDVRICIDFTKLNESVKRENYPLPAVEESLAKLANARMFSKLHEDANSSFWQTNLAEESRPLTTFITPFGRYCCSRLPYGINSASEFFQKRMSETVAGYPGVLCHMDDVLVFGASQESTHEILENFRSDRKSRSHTERNSWVKSLTRWVVETTPLANGYSRAELLMGHKLRTLVPVAPKNLTPKLPNTRELSRKEDEYKFKQKQYYDRRHRARPFSNVKTNDRVWVKDQRKWGIIKAESNEPRSYVIETDSGEIHRNRRDFSNLPEKPDTKIAKNNFETIPDEIPIHNNELKDNTKD